MTPIDGQRLAFAEQRHEHYRFHPTFRFAMPRTGTSRCHHLPAELAPTIALQTEWRSGRRRAAEPDHLKRRKIRTYTTRRFGACAQRLTTVGPFSTSTFQTGAALPPPRPVGRTIPTGPAGPSIGGWPPAPGTRPPKPPNIVTVDVEEVRARVRWGLWNWQSSDDESYWMNQIVLAPERGHTPGWVSDDYWYDKIARGDGVGRGYVWPPR